MRPLEWLGNAVSIGLFTALALLSWTLSEYLQRGLGQAPRSGSGPNAIVEAANIVRTNASGEPVFRLRAARIVHNEDLDQSEFTQPRLTSLRPDQPLTLVQSDRALSQDKQNKIDLFGQVVVDRAASASQPALLVRTPRLTLFVDEERAFTDAPVFVRRGQSTLQGVGMRLDNKLEKLEIISESRMVIPKEDQK